VRFAIDASVAAKWVLAASPVEQDTGKAALLLSRIADENATLLQPEHWRVEVLSIVARLAPDRFDRTWRLLESLNVEWQSSKRVNERAMLLSNQLKHHFFDTLYHAIAIEHDASLITADDAYFAKAFRFGNIQLLTNFSAS
jgi:predicted nucleic acid-binding protein